MARQPPSISKELIDWLGELYPDRCPDPLDTDQQVRVHMGEQRVVRRLIKEYDRQTHNVLETG